MIFAFIFRHMRRSRTMIRGITNKALAWPGRTQEGTQREAYWPQGAIYQPRQSPPSSSITMTSTSTQQRWRGQDREIG